MSDLTIHFKDTRSVSVSSYRGRILLVSVLQLQTCHTVWTVELIDEVAKRFDLQEVSAIACCVDVERPTDIPEMPMFVTPIGWAKRRDVADLLHLSMSGFTLPKIVMVDKEGVPHIFKCRGSSGEKWAADLHSLVNETLLSADCLQRQELGEERV